MLPFHEVDASVRPAGRRVAFGHTADLVELPDSTREREPRMTPPDSQHGPIVWRATPADLQRIRLHGAPRAGGRAA